MRRWLLVLCVLTACSQASSQAPTTSAPTPATPTTEPSTTSSAVDTTQASAAADAAPSPEQVCDWLPGLPFPLRMVAVEGSELDLEGECPEELATFEDLRTLWNQAKDLAGRSGGLGNDAMVFQASNNQCDVESGGVRNTILTPVQLAVSTYQKATGNTTLLFNGFVSESLDLGESLSFDMPLAVDSEADGCGFSAKAFVADDSRVTDTVDGSLVEYQLPDTNGEDLGEVLSTLHSLAPTLADTPELFGLVYDMRSAEYADLTEGRIPIDPLIFLELCDSSISGGAAQATYLVQSGSTVEITFSVLRKSSVDDHWRFLAESVGRRPANDCSVFNPASPTIPSQRY